MIFRKNFRRKKEQEENLRQINKQLEKIRNNHIEKYREIESVNRSRNKIDISRIKAQIEFELRSSFNKNNNIT